MMRTPSVRSIQRCNDAQVRPLPFAISLVSESSATWARFVETWEARPNFSWALLPYDTCDGVDGNGDGDFAERPSAAGPASAEGVAQECVVQRGVRGLAVCWEKDTVHWISLAHCATTEESTDAGADGQRGGDGDGDGVVATVADVVARVMSSSGVKKFCARAVDALPLLQSLGVRECNGLTDVCLMGGLAAGRTRSLRQLLEMHDATAELATPRLGCTGHEACCLEAAQVCGWLYAAVPFFDRQLKPALSRLMSATAVLTLPSGTTGEGTTVPMPCVSTRRVVGLAERETEVRKALHAQTASVAAAAGLSVDELVGAKGMAAALGSSASCAAAKNLGHEGDGRAKATGSVDKQLRRRIWASPVAAHLVRLRRASSRKTLLLSRESATTAMARTEPAASQASHVDDDAPGLSLELRPCTASGMLLPTCTDLQVRVDGALTSSVPQMGLCAALTEELCDDVCDEGEMQECAAAAAALEEGSLGKVRADGVVCSSAAVRQAATPPGTSGAAPVSAAGTGTDDLASFSAGLRRCFVAPRRSSMLAVRLVNLDLCALAHLSEDGPLREAAAEPAQLVARTASVWMRCGEPCSRSRLLTRRLWHELLDGCLLPAVDDSDGEEGAAGTAQDGVPLGGAASLHDSPVPTLAPAATQQRPVRSVGARGEAVARVVQAAPPLHVAPDAAPEPLSGRARRSNSPAAVGAPEPADARGSSSVGTPGRAANPGAVVDAPDRVDTCMRSAMARLLDAFRGVEKYRRKLIQQARGGGQLRTLGGRLLDAYGVNSATPGQRDAAAAGLLGMACRESAADISTELICALAEPMQARGARLLVQTRGELLLLVGEGSDVGSSSGERDGSGEHSVDAWKAVVDRALDGVKRELQLRVPLVAEVTLGSDWSPAHGPRV